jgi:putative ABC transport system substrate-binding protein
LGYTEGQNITIEYRWAEGQYDRLLSLAADLAGRHVAVILAGGGNAPAKVAKAVTGTIPIVFVSGDDPVQAGLVPSLNHPDGNVTGVAFFNSVLVGKRLALLHELLPRATFIGFVVNPHSLQAAQETHDAQQAAQTLGLKLQILDASSVPDIDSGFAKAHELQAQAVLIAADPFFGARRDQIAALAVRYALPVMGTTREYAASGTLISYGTSVREAYRQGGIYVGRILKGEKAADLPVIQPTKFELVINLKTAKALDLNVPLTLQMTADEVIE